MITSLVQKYGEEKAAEEWITTVGPLQTATFGGDSFDKVDQKRYWIRFREEFDKLICGHPTYEEDLKKILFTGKSLGTGAVTYIATIIGPVIGMAPAILVPPIILLLHTVTKITVKAYCTTRHFE